MRKPPPLSAEQLRAIEFAKTQGGSLWRHDEGWGPQVFDVHSTSFDHLFSGGTVRALVTRKVMRWSYFNGIVPTRAAIV